MKKIAALAGVVETVQKQVRNKTRKSLQTLQTNSEVTEKNMVRSEGKNLPPNKEKQSKAAERVIEPEKENAPILRRSKRKPVVSDIINAPEELKPSKSGAKNSKVKSKKTITKPKKGNSTLMKKSEQKIKLSQTKLNFSPISVGSVPICNKVFEDLCEPEGSEKTALSTSISSEVTEDSGIVPSAGTSHQSSPPPSIVFKSPYIKSDSAIPPDSENSILTVDSPPRSYWEDLSEQRRIALERALHENELLHDQLAVLEAENLQLKQLVKEAEELAKVVKGIIE